MVQGLWDLKLQCLKCGQLYDQDIMSKTHPFCSVCGHHGENTDVVKHIAVREVKTGKWWQFWKKKTKEFKAIG